MMDKWHRLRKAIDMGHAEKDAEKLLHSYDLDYARAEWPNLASQIVDCILRPSAFDEMPNKLSDVEVHLHINEQYINKQIDLPPGILLNFLICCLCAELGKNF